MYVFWNQDWRRYQVALCGWLLDASGFVKESAVQPESCLNMLYVMYLWIPMILSLCITFIMSKMNVEAANQKLRAQLRNVDMHHEGMEEVVFPRFA